MTDPATASSEARVYTVVGFAGSLRRGSYNRALLRAAIELAPAGLHIETHELDALPLYNGDVEAAGVPQSVEDLRRDTASGRVADCHPRIQPRGARRPEERDRLVVKTAAW